MFQPKTPNERRAYRVQYVVADPQDAGAQGISNRYDRAENPCQTGTDEECAKWLSERLTELYND